MYAHRRGPRLCTGISCESWRARVGEKSRAYIRAFYTAAAPRPRARGPSRSSSSRSRAPVASRQSCSKSVSVADASALPSAAPATHPQRSPIDRVGPAAAARALASLYTSGCFIRFSCTSLPRTFWREFAEAAAAFSDLPPSRFRLFRAYIAALEDAGGREDGGGAPGGPGTARQPGPRGQRARAPAAPAAGALRGRPRLRELPVLLLASDLHVARGGPADRGGGLLDLGRGLGHEEGVARQPRHPPLDPPRAGPLPPDRRPDDRRRQQESQGLRALRHDARPARPLRPRRRLPRRRLRRAGEQRALALPEAAAGPRQGGARLRRDRRDDPPARHPDQRHVRRLVDARRGLGDGPRPRLRLALPRRAARAREAADRRGGEDAGARAPAQERADRHRGQQHPRMRGRRGGGVEGGALFSRPFRLGEVARCAVRAYIEASRTRLGGSAILVRDVY